MKSQALFLGLPPAWGAVAAAIRGRVPAPAAADPTAPSPETEPSMASDQPLLNRELLEGMARNVPPQVFRKLMSRGLDGAVESFDLLLKALGDRERLLQLAHRLRGTAGSFGLARVSVLASMIEERADRGEDVADLVVELGRVVQISRTAMQQLERSA